MSGDAPTGLLVGVAGWSYADWQGVVHPRGSRDVLRDVARFVDFVEVNSTFYRTPKVEVVASWAERTEDLRTRFTAKLPRSVTHEGRVFADEVRGFRNAIEPLVRSGRLDVLLAQYSERFSDSPRSREYLAAVHRAFGDLAPLAIELRHRGWQNPESVEAVRGLGFRPVFLDWPGVLRANEGDRGFAGPSAPESELAYFRAHGRNLEAWDRKGAGRDEVYDHLYSDTELDETTRLLDRLGSTSKRVYAVANNHFQGQAMVLAMQWKSHREGGSVEVPDTLRARFPQLGRIARGGSAGLFESEGSSDV